MTGDEEVLARALGYPYPREPDSFCWRDGRVEPLLGRALDDGLPCVAYGSNASPRQLARKFSDLGGIEIPTVRARLLDHDVVYAALFAHYGSIPATLVPSPGTAVEVWVQSLAPRALARMDETEGVPGFYERVSGLEVVLEDGSRPDPSRIFSYLAVAGELLSSGEPVALSEVPASGRRFKALGQREIQEEIQARLGIGGSVGDFVRGNVARPALRRERVKGPVWK